MKPSFKKKCEKCYYKLYNAFGTWIRNEYRYDDIISVMKRYAEFVSYGGGIYLSNRELRLALTHIIEADEIITNRTLYGILTTIISLPHYINDDYQYVEYVEKFKSYLNKDTKYNPNFILRIVEKQSRLLRKTRSEDFKRCMNPISYKKIDISNLTELIGSINQIRHSIESSTATLERLEKQVKELLAKDSVYSSTEYLNKLSTEYLNKLSKHINESNT